MKVLFLTNIPSPYRVEFFNQLGTFCDLTVLYQKERSSERDKKWIGVSNDSYKKVFLSGISTGVDQSISFEVLKYLRKGKYDKIFICGIASPTEMLALIWCKLRRIPYYFESDGGIPKSGKGIKELVKKFNLSGAHKYLSTGKMHDEYYRAYGIDSKKIIHYPFSSVTQSEIIKSPVSKKRKKELRSSHGINARIVAVTVGQFIYRKGLDILIKAWGDMKQDAALVIVGGIPPEEYINLVSKNENKNIVFVPFLKKDELSEYYQMADVFVFPTREDIWGLVVNEAMAHGLPIISTDRSGAAVELVSQNENGYIVRHESVSELSDRMQKFDQLTEEEMFTMSSKSLEKVRQYTIEKMVKRHLEI